MRSIFGMGLGVSVGGDIWRWYMKTMPSGRCGLSDVISALVWMSFVSAGLCKRTSHMGVSTDISWRGCQCTHPAFIYVVTDLTVNTDWFCARICLQWVLIDLTVRTDISWRLCHPIDLCHLVYTDWLGCKHWHILKGLPSSRPSCNIL